MTTLERVRKSLARGGDVLRRVIGAPDYARYLEHMRSHHPEKAPLSASDFAQAQLVNRYSRPGARCC